MRAGMVLSILGLMAAGCGSTPVDEPSDAAAPVEGAQAAEPAPPSAPAVAYELSKAPACAAPAPDPHSPSRVLGYVEGDVVTYREVFQRIEAQLAQVDDPDD